MSSPALISFDEAICRIGEVAQPSAIERVPLAQASARVLAEPIIARGDSPPSDSSAMDGYAVRDADLPGMLRLMGESFAGSGFDGSLDPGCCVRIFTGAPVPEGADRVVVQEIVTRAGEFATFAGSPGESRHIRPQGSDFRAGDTLLEPGCLLGPRALVAAASADREEVVVWRQPRVVVLATGDELATPGQAHLTRGKIPESVSYGVAAMVDQWGASFLETSRLPDALEPMERAAGEALERADLIVVTGGASVGERDLAKAMFSPYGLETVFSKVAMKPGKPVWLGQARGRLILGLPGNPTSAMVTARLLLAPLVAGLCGRTTALEWEDISLAEPLPPCGDRETFIRARRTPQGAVLIRNQDSSAQRALVESDLLLRSPAHAHACQAGEMVEAIAF